MFVFSPANKKRLRTNTAYLQTDCLNPKSREARRRKERIERAKELKSKRHHHSATDAPQSARKGQQV